MGGKEKRERSSFTHRRWQRASSHSFDPGWWKSMPGNAASGALPEQSSHLNLGGKKGTDTTRRRHSSRRNKEESKVTRTTRRNRYSELQQDTAAARIAALAAASATSHIASFPTTVCSHTLTVSPGFSGILIQTSSGPLKLCSSLACKSCCFTSIQQPLPSPLIIRRLSGHFQAFASPLRAGRRGI